MNQHKDSGELMWTTLKGVQKDNTHAHAHARARARARAKNVGCKTNVNAIKTCLQQYKNIGEFLWENEAKIWKFGTNLMLLK